MTGARPSAGQGRAACTEGQAGGGGGKQAREHVCLFGTCLMAHGVPAATSPVPTGRSQARPAASGCSPAGVGVGVGAQREAPQRCKQSGVVWCGSLRPIPTQALACHVHRYISACLGLLSRHVHVIIYRPRGPMPNTQCVAASLRLPAAARCRRTSLHALVVALPYARAVVLLLESVGVEAWHASQLQGQGRWWWGQGQGGGCM